MTEQAEKAADALAAAAEDMLKSLWRYCYELPEQGDGPHANDRLRQALAAYRAATGRVSHDCLASVPAPPGGGSWSELAIPGVTTWRCGCGQEWVWRRTGWERLVDAEPDVEEGRFDRAVLAASLAEAVSAVDAAARRLRATWRNVGGDTGHVEPDRFERHAAPGGARWAQAMFEALMGDGR